MSCRPVADYVGSDQQAEPTGHTFTFVHDVIVAPPTSREADRPFPPFPVATPIGACRPARQRAKAHVPEFDHENHT